MIAIIDYSTGNLRSVGNALSRIGAEWTLTADPRLIRQADRVLLPGVGHCGEALARLRATGLDTVIRDLRHPVLGICVGMQMMCRDTEEGDAQGLGIFDAHVRRFIPGPDDKVPHMGWNSIHNLEKGLFKGIPSGAFVYYVHSYYANLCPDTIATEALARLRATGLDTVIRDLRHPVLGICVGMQMMCRDTEEGDAQGLGIFDAHVRRFIPGPDDKVPHMGWNSIHNLEKGLFKGIPSGAFVYYVHSYYANLCPDTIATTRFGSEGQMFSAALKYENFYGTQFHPEKSGDIGEQILCNFLKL